MIQLSNVKPDYIFKCEEKEYQLFILQQTKENFAGIAVSPSGLHWFTGKNTGERMDITMKLFADPAANLHFSATGVQTYPMQCKFTLVGKDIHMGEVIEGNCFGGGLKESKVAVCTIEKTEKHFSIV